MRILVVRRFFLERYFLARVKEKDGGRVFWVELSGVKMGEDRMVSWVVVWDC